jgi:hypothetical protein
MWIQNKGKITPEIRTSLNQKLNPMTKLVCSFDQHEIILNSAKQNLDQIRESIPFQKVHISVALLLLS